MTPRITPNETYDDLGRAIKPLKFHPRSPRDRKMPDWWIEFGWDVQIHNKPYYKGVEIVEIDNFDPPVIESTTDPMTIQWSLTLDDGTYVMYKPESRAIAEFLYGSELWRRNRQWAYRR